MTTTTIANRPVPHRGRTFVGKVISDKMMDTVTVEWERKRFVQKYQRNERRRSKIKAHNPKEIHAKVGDVVLLEETRPISKTKNFVVAKILSHEEAITKEEEVAKLQPSAAPKKTAKKEEPKEEPKAEASDDE